MSHALSRIIDEFRGLDVLVIGEAMLDTYLEGTTDRLCREAPVPVVAVDGRRDAPGGAANAAVNAAALGAKVRFLSVVGDDGEARVLRQALARSKVDTDDLLIDPARAHPVQEPGGGVGPIARPVRPGEHRPGRRSRRSRAARPAPGAVPQVRRRDRRRLRLRHTHARSDRDARRPPAAVAPRGGRRLEGSCGLSGRRADGGQAELRGGRPARCRPLRRPARLASRADHRLGRTLPRHHRRQDGRRDARCRGRRPPRARPSAVSVLREAVAPFPRRGRRRHVPHDARPSARGRCRDSGRGRPRLGRVGRRRLARGDGRLHGRRPPRPARPGREGRGQPRRPAPTRRGSSPRRAADRLHQRLLRHPPPRPYVVPESREGAGRRARRRRQLRREHPPAQGRVQADQRRG